MRCGGSGCLRCGRSRARARKGAKAAGIPGVSSTATSSKRAKRGREYAPDGCGLRPKNYGGACFSRGFFPFRNPGGADKRKAPSGEVRSGAVCHSPGGARVRRWSLSRGCTPKNGTAPRRGCHSFTQRTVFPAFRPLRHAGQLPLSAGQSSLRPQRFRARPSCFGDRRSRGGPAFRPGQLQASFRGRGGVPSYRPGRVPGHVRRKGRGLSPGLFHLPAIPRNTRPGIRRTLRGSWGRNTPAALSSRRGRIPVFPAYPKRGHDSRGARV